MFPVTEKAGQTLVAVRAEVLQLPGKLPELLFKEHEPEEEKQYQSKKNKNKQYHGFSSSDRQRNCLSANIVFI
jgi:hypothetical protein